MIGVAAVNTYYDPHITAIYVQDAHWSREEAIWFDETSLVEGLWIRTTPEGGIGFVG